MELSMIELTPEICEQITTPLVERHRRVTARLEQEMTETQAALVRLWRVDLGCTWGKIGEKWCELYPWAEGGQILGKALCIRAAELLEEDPFDEPWN